MHYYQFNIDDYKKDLMMRYYYFNVGQYSIHANHLNDEEDLCLRRLIDLYFNEKGGFPDLKMTARKIRFSDRENLVKEIHDKFFVKMDIIKKIGIRNEK